MKSNELAHQHHAPGLEIVPGWKLIIWSDGEVSLVKGLTIVQVDPPKIPQEHDKRNFPIETPSGSYAIVKGPEEVNEIRAELEREVIS